MKTLKKVLIVLVVAVALFFLFQELPSVATVLSACLLFFLYFFFRGNKKAPEVKDDREKVVARRITYIGDEDEVFYCEFYMRGVHRYGYLEELETPEMEEQVKKGENPDLKLECYVEGIEVGVLGRWMVTPVNIVEDEE